MRELRYIGSFAGKFFLWSAIFVSSVYVLFAEGRISVECQNETRMTLARSQPNKVKNPNSDSWIEKNTYGDPFTLLSSRNYIYNNKELTK